MNLGEQIRERRRALGLTQEQMAAALGVTAPAVHKWEKGVTCPDVALLPALARLLEIDLNTLFSFHGEPTEEEMGGTLNEAARAIEAQGFAAGRAILLERLRNWPRSASLRQQAAMLLEGALMMSGLPEAEKAPYLAEIRDLYAEAAAGTGPDAGRARYMLAARQLAEERYEEAEATLSLLPENDQPDKRGLQADLWAKTGRREEAGALMEKKLMQQLQENQTTLLRLARWAAEDGEMERASAIADCARSESERYGLWAYSAWVVPLETAVAAQDKGEALRCLEGALTAVKAPWQAGDPRIFTRLTALYADAPRDVGNQFLGPLLAELETAPAYDFLRDDPAFQSLLARHRAARTP